MSNSFATLWTVAHQAPLSMVFPRQEYWEVIATKTLSQLIFGGLVRFKQDQKKKKKRILGRPFCSITLVKLELLQIFFLIKNWKYLLHILV